jgi:D-alanyl-lipoteichoic acid acyltransferase DltB (MBOAT superfamily)
MLFNSNVFIFAFLPIVLFGFFLFARFSQHAAAGFLVAASLFFYGWWNPTYIGLLLASILGNHVAGMAIARAHAIGASRRRQMLLAGAVAANLALLGYYKYANFFRANLDALGITHIGTLGIVLPLGISFFTFTQIAFLIDTAQGEVREYNLIHYALFVTYFPHLIAGPILHHKEMMPQFAHSQTYRFSYLNASVGLTIFLIGLFKKTFLADSMAPAAGEVFAAAEAGRYLQFFEAWFGALAYTLQLYFDFSGYSDMAIGLARLFGIVLPLNFASPYKATSITEFWRRWHMTLSRFLRDYLYFPLGGNRHGPSRRYLNLMVTMLLGGLWHGAGWTFVAWGGLHGAYLVIHQLWRSQFKGQGIALSRPFKYIATPVAVAITFGAVVIGWVLFRAATFTGAMRMLAAMSGRHGFALPKSWSYDLQKSLVDRIEHWGFEFTATAAQLDIALIWWIPALLAIVWLLPNTQQLMREFHPALGRIETEGRSRLARITWAPKLWWMIAIALIGLLALASGNDVSQFLYFQF